MAVGLKDGRVLNGIRVAETEAVLTLADQEGQSTRSRSQTSKRSELAADARV